MPVERISINSLDKLSEVKNNFDTIDDAVTPLAKFVLAKKAVNHVFNETEVFMKDVYEFYRSFAGIEIYNVDTTLLPTEISSYINRIKVIRTILMRDNMKLAFFGRTSNGKSTVINAMLGDKILPSGIGHTTSCFVAMKGCLENEPFVITPDSHEKRNVKDLGQLANALSNSTLGPNNLINVYWPIKKCPILENHVVFLDSPGIDVDCDLDSWIEQFCLDADVFVLVVNSESTLNNAEKNFFYKVNKHISSPNIFIVNNRWDASARELDSIDAIKAQHLKRSVEFLNVELKCATHDEAIERVFFTSARETLYDRTTKSNTNKDTFPHETTPGFHERLEEFKKFEAKLKHTLYRSAITTKFSAHCSQSNDLLNNVAQQLDRFIESANIQRESLQKELNEMKLLKEKVINKSKTGYKQIQIEISSVSKLVHQKIYQVFVEEINYLEALVRSFDYPFNPTEHFLQIYKRDMLLFIGEKLESNATNHISTQLMSPIKQLTQSIQAYSSSVITNEQEKKELETIINKISFDWFCHFDISTLCSDFECDLSFQFFFNPVSLIRWIISKIYCSRHTQSTTSALKDINGSYQSNTNECAAKVSSDSNQTLDISLNTSITDVSNINDSNPAVQQSIDDLTSTLCTSTCILVGLGAKVVGLRFILCVSIGVGLMLSIKWLMWTNSAKRNFYIKQFVYYAEKKLMSSAKFICSQNCKLVEKNLQNSLSKVHSHIEAYMSELDSSINKKIYDIKNLDQIIEHAISHREKCRNILEKLNSFCIEYGLPSKKI